MVWPFFKKQAPSADKSKQARSFSFGLKESKDNVVQLAVVERTVPEAVERAKYDKIPHVRNYEELQPYQGVLTSTGGVLAIPESQQKEVALLGLGSNNAFLVSIENYFGSAQHLTLVARAKKVGVAIQTQIIVEDPAILALIYDKDRRKLSNRQEDSGSKADSVQLFESLISEAVTERSTDIHFLMRDDTSAVIFRIDGRLHQVRIYPTYMLDEAAGVAFNKMAEESSRSHPAYNKRMAQSCSVIINNAAGRALKLRYQSIPVVGGADIILRVLFTDDEDRPSPTLEQLGYSKSQQKLLTLASRKTVGSIFIAGVTGSGKSTTLKTLMTMNPERHQWKQYSVEDPAEYKMSGISQLSVQRTADATADSVGSNPFVAAMRTIMRADPDEIMVGEVRDQESGSLLKTMVQSGHQVYTTVHAASAMDIPERLTSEEIGLARQTLSSRNFVSAFVYQRLLALNCEHCKMPAEGHLPDDYLALIEKKFGIARNKLWVARNWEQEKADRIAAGGEWHTETDGCPHCKDRGVKGLTVVAEIIVPDNDILKLIREGRDMEAEELWRSRRVAAFDEEDCEGKTAFEHALLKMSQGLLDPHTIEDSFEPLESYQVFDKQERAA